MIYAEPKFLAAGDAALVAELGDEISPEINRRVRSLSLALEQGGIPGVFDFLPTYRSVLVFYDPLELSAAALQDGLTRLLQSPGESAESAPQVAHIPVLYGGDMGPDIGFVAQHAGVSEQEVISIHSGANYLVYMMGFIPGFAYLGGLDERLTTPRLQSPRAEIPAGAVGIAEAQTGVYPVASPGGWQLIGRTPLKLFDPGREPPALLAAGDYARFVPLDDADQYQAIQRQVQAGEYRVAKEALSE